MLGPMLQHMTFNMCDDWWDVQVDTSLSTGRVGLKAFVSTPVVIQGEGLANTFDQVQVDHHQGWLSHHSHPSSNSGCCFSFILLCSIYDLHRKSL